jgi:hypothetical protein
MVGLAKEMNVPSSESKNELARVEKIRVLDITLRPERWGIFEDALVRD